LKRVLRIAAFWIGLVISAAFAFFVVRDVDWGSTLSALRHCNYAWLAPALGAIAISVAVRAERWRVLFRPEQRPPYGPVMKATLVGLLFNIILPLRAGEAARIVALKSYAGTSRAESTTTVVVERLYDVLSLLFLLFASVAWLPQVSWLLAASIVALVAAAGAITLVVVARLLARDRGIAGRRVLRLPLLDDETVRRLTVNALHGLAALRRPRQAVLALAWTLVSWFVLALAFWFLMIGFRLHLSLLAGLLVAIATGLSFIVPAAPGAVGVFEAAGLAVTNAYGVPHSQALAYVLVLHAVNVFPFVIAGLTVLALGGGARAPKARLSITGGR
jgi:glycosyltransferase 2 family protein